MLKRCQQATPPPSQVTARVSSQILRLPQSKGSIRRIGEMYSGVRLTLRRRVLLHHHRSKLPCHPHEVMWIGQIRFAGLVYPLNGLVGQEHVERSQVILQLSV